MGWNCSPLPAASKAALTDGSSSSFAYLPPLLICTLCHALPPPPPAVTPLLATYSDALMYPPRPLPPRMPPLGLCALMDGLALPAWYPLLPPLPPAMFSSSSSTMFLKLAASVLGPRRFLIPPPRSLNDTVLPPPPPPLDVPWP